MWFATCHNPAGEWVPSAGRCDLPALEHRNSGAWAGPVCGVYYGMRLSPGAVCGGLVCGVCGTCQGGLRREEAAA